MEADEYDSAFFDKRSKFVHYRPRTAILNNLEYDHADIFPDLDAIKKQFHHLVRTIPGEGLIISPACENNINDVLAMGCWTPIVRSSINGSADWNAEFNKRRRQPIPACIIKARNKAASSGPAPATIMFIMPYPPSPPPGTSAFSLQTPLPPWVNSKTSSGAWK